MKLKPLFAVCLAALLAAASCARQDPVFYFTGFPESGDLYPHTGEADDVDIWPNSIDGYLDRAVAFIKLERYNEAIMDCSFLLEAVSDYLKPALGTRALAHLNAGNLDHAMEDINSLGRAYFEGEPQDAWLNYISGIISWLLGDTDAANEKIMEAIHLDPLYSSIRSDYRRYFRNRKRLLESTRPR